jgi:hypothetical protein
MHNRVCPASAVLWVSFVCNFIGCRLGIAQAVACPLPTVIVWAQSQVRSYGTSG